MTVLVPKPKSAKTRGATAEKARLRQPLAKVKASRSHKSEKTLNSKAKPKPSSSQLPAEAKTQNKRQQQQTPPNQQGDESEQTALIQLPPSALATKKKAARLSVMEITDLGADTAETVEAVEVVDTAESDEVHTEIQLFKERRRPGPPPADAISAPERDLKDASLILDASDHGGLFPREKTPEIPIDEKFHDFSSRLTSEEECHLALRIQQQGDIDARNTLVLANIGLVHLIANQFRRPHLRYEDLLQEGTMGLIRATETFEPARNVRFSTYSVYWIRAKIQRHIQRLDKDDVPSITGAEVIQSPDGSKAKRPRARKLSIEYSVEGEGSSKRFGELLASDINNPEELAMQHQRDIAIKQVLEEIVAELGDERLTAIIEGRLLADEPATLTELGEKLGLSREGARLLESKMIKLARLRLSQWQE
jgi:RNA polymerase sigma factor (sigma-70 family)